jgi:RNA polymerase sigma factor (TIGR02999 family)
MSDEPGQITALLERIQHGDAGAESALAELIYCKLHQIAVNQLRHENPGHSFQPTLLVSELYTRLKLQPVDWQGRAHLYAIAARTMRHILVDHARKINAQRRPPPVHRVDFDEAFLYSDERTTQVLLVNEALDRLAEYDARQAQIVEMRFFGGLSTEEIAEELGISERTVKRDWAMARAWLSKLWSDSSADRSVAGV